MDIYIKPAEKVQLVGKREVLLRDVAEVFLSGQTAGEAERLVVFRIPEERKKTYLLSVVDLIQVLHRKYPNAAVNNVAGGGTQSLMGLGEGGVCFSGAVRGSLHNDYVLSFGYTAAVDF